MTKVWGILFHMLCKSYTAFLNVGRNGGGGPNIEEEKKENMNIKSSRMVK